MDLLLRAGANINVQGHKRKTPLIACLAGFCPNRLCVKMCQLLVEAGADPNLTDEGGRNAVDWARQRNSPEIMDVLRQAGGMGTGTPLPQAGIDLDVPISIRPGRKRYAVVTPVGEVALPTPRRLKTATLETLQATGAPGDKEAAVALRQCDLSYELVPDKDILEQLIQVIIAAPPRVFALLEALPGSIAKAITAALEESCPDIGSFRIVEKP